MLDCSLKTPSNCASKTQIPLRGMPEFVLNKGLQKNVRLVWDSDSKKQILAILQIRPKKAAFISAIFLREFLCHRMNLNPNELANRLANEEMREKAESLIKGLSLITTHSNLTFKVAGLTPERAEQLYFLHEGRQVNVVQYMEQRYGQRVNSALPCVIRKRGNFKEHFPIELLKILPGQRVKGENQSKIQLAQQMIRECQILPVHMRNQIQEKRRELCIDDGNEFLEAFGIRVENELIDTKKVHRLIPPAIKYDRACIEPNNNGGEYGK